MAQQIDTIPPESGSDSNPGGPRQPAGRARATESGSTTVAGLLVKIVLLGMVLGIAVMGAFPLIERRNWAALVLLALVTAAIFYIYLSRRNIPAKYLIPGTLFLIAFQVFPVLYTMSTAFSNFGDAHRGTKQEAITAIQSGSVQQVPGSALYALSIGVQAIRRPRPWSSSSRTTRPRSHSSARPKGCVSWRPTRSGSPPRARSSPLPATPC